MYRHLHCLLAGADYFVAQRTNGICCKFGTLGHHVSAKDANHVGETAAGFGAHLFGCVAEVVQFLGDVCQFVLCLAHPAAQLRERLAQRLTEWALPFLFSKVAVLHRQVGERRCHFTDAPLCRLCHRFHAAKSASIFYGCLVNVLEGGTRLLQGLLECQQALTRLFQRRVVFFVLNSEA